MIGLSIQTYSKFLTASWDVLCCPSDVRDDFKALGFVDLTDYTVSLGFPDIYSTILCLTALAGFGIGGNILCSTRFLMAGPLRHSWCRSEAQRADWRAPEEGCLASPDRWSRSICVREGMGRTLRVCCIWLVRFRCCAW